MRKIWASFLLLLLMLSIMKPISSNYEHVAIVFILLHSIFILIALMTYKNTKITILLGLGFLLRIFLVFWDRYAREIFILPNAATDDVGFYQSARMISGNLSLLSENIYGGLYAKLTGIIFYFTGPSRILGGYMNVLLGISVIIVILKTMNLLKVPYKIKILLVSILAFFPNSLFMSAMFRREILITFLIAQSLYCFAKWFLFNKDIYMFLSIFFILLGSLFHSGIIGIISGYIFAYVFYKHSSETFKFSKKSIFYFLIILLFLLLMYWLLGEQLTTKFGDVDDISGVIDSSNRGGGNARYLGNLTISNPLELIIYTPIKMFYFLFSPVPWDWRGLGDIITFLFDSTFYILCIIYFIKNKKKFNSAHQLVYVLLLSIVVTTIIFGIGVGNAGTAMRHRQKLLPVFSLSLALMMTERRREKVKNC